MMAEIHVFVSFIFMFLNLRIAQPYSSRTLQITLRLLH